MRRKFLGDFLPLEICNMLKMDSNDIEARVGVDLIKLVETGLVKVVGVLDDKLLYQKASDEEIEEFQTL